MGIDGRSIKSAYSPVNATTARDSVSTLSAIKFVCAPTVDDNDKIDEAWEFTKVLKLSMFKFDAVILDRSPLMLFVKVVLKLELFAKLFDISLRVSNVVGAPPIKLSIAESIAELT